MNKRKILAILEVIIQDLSDKFEKGSSIAGYKLETVKEIKKIIESLE